MAKSEKVDKWTGEQVDKWTSRRVNELLVREDKVTDEQVFSEQVDELTSGRVNELIARKDKVTGEQVFSEQVDELTSGRVNKWTSKRVACERRQGNRWTDVYSSTLKTLFLCYFVFYLPCLQATRSLVHSFTRLLVHLVNFFQALREQEVVFWLLKDALLAGKRCPLRPLLTPFWSLNKHLLV